MQTICVLVNFLNYVPASKDTRGQGDQHLPISLEIHLNYFFNLKCTYSLVKVFSQVL